MRNRVASPSVVILLPSNGGQGSEEQVIAGFIMIQSGETVVNGWACHGVREIGAVEMRGSMSRKHCPLAAGRADGKFVSCIAGRHLCLAIQLARLSGTSVLLT